MPNNSLICNCDCGCNCRCVVKRDSDPDWCLATFYWVGSLFGASLMGGLAAIAEYSNNKVDSSVCAACSAIHALLTLGFAYGTFKATGHSLNWARQNYANPKIDSSDEESREASYSPAVVRNIESSETVVLETADSTKRPIA